MFTKEQKDAGLRHVLAGVSASAAQAAKDETADPVAALDSIGSAIRSARRLYGISATNGTALPPYSE